MSPDGKAINERFFHAIELLKETGQLKGVKTFATKYGVNQGNLTSVKTHMDAYTIKPEYLMYLVRDFSMSAEWLLLGVGSPFIHP